MSGHRKESLTVRISQRLWAAVRMSAAQESTNLTKTVELVITQYCVMHRIPINGPFEIRLAYKRNRLPVPHGGDKDKMVPVNIRLPPEISEAFRTAARLDTCSLAKMLEVMALAYCRANGIPVEWSRETDTVLESGRKNGQRG